MYAYNLTLDLETEITYSHIPSPGPVKARPLPAELFTRFI